MHQLAALSVRLLWILLVSLAAVVALRVLTGRIPLAGLLTTTGPDPRFSPSRAQLLFVTAITALALLLNGDVPPGWAFALAGSHAVYLVAKGVRSWRG